VIVTFAFCISVWGYITEWVTVYGSYSCSVLHLSYYMSYLCRCPNTSIPHTCTKFTMANRQLHMGTPLYPVQVYLGLPNSYVMFYSGSLETMLWVTTASHVHDMVYHNIVRMSTMVNRVAHSYTLKQIGFLCMVHTHLLYCTSVTICHTFVGAQTLVCHIHVQRLPW